MNWIEKMIAEQCPKGVKSIELAKICRLSQGTQIDKKKQSLEYYDGSLPFLRIIDFTQGNEEPRYVSNEYANYLMNNDDVAMVRYGAAGYVCTGKYGVLANNLFKITPLDANLSKRFLYHCLSSIHTQKRIKESIQQGGLPAISFKFMNRLPIPLPPLSIQEEIVSVLDKFSELIEKTDEEIALRQKQYEYYREKLLTFEKGEDCKEMSLGEIGKMKRGNGLQKSDFRANGFPCIHYGQIHTSYGLEAKETISFCENSLAKKLKKAKYGDLLIATTSEDVEACCKAVVWLGNEEVAFSGDSFCFSHNQNPKYISYLFCTEQFAKQKRKVATGAKVVRVSGDAMEKFTFLFPSLSRQQEIVATLDKFEALIASLKEECELRQKQYEYYREKLLTF